MTQSLYSLFTEIVACLNHLRYSHMHSARRNINNKIWYVAS